MWAANEGFGLPIGVNGFSSEYSAHCDDVHREINFTPTAEFRSPAQQLQWEQDAAERKRVKALRDEETKQEEIRRLFEEEEMKRLSADAAALAIAAQSDPFVLYLAKYAIGSRSVFEGLWVNKKFTSEMLYRKRYVWIDFDSKRLYWSKIEGREDPNRKSIDLANDVSEIKVNTNNFGFVVMQKELNGRSIAIQVVSGDKERVVLDFAKVAEAMRTDH